MERWLVWTSLAATATAFALSAYLVARLEGQTAGAPLGLEAVYREHLAGTRMIAGALLVLVWPAMLHLGARLLRLQFRRPSSFLTWLGLLLGALGYCLSFLPWPALTSAILIPPVVALGLYKVVLRLSGKRATLLWVVQGVPTLALGAACVWGLESAATGTALNPLREIPAIYRAARHAPAGRAVVPFNRDKQSYILVWPASGSVWVDRRANRAQAHIEIPPFADKWYVSISVGEETYATASGNGNVAATPVLVPRPDTGYHVHVQPTPQPGTGAQVTSLMPLKGPGYTEPR